MSCCKFALEVNLVNVVYSAISQLLELNYLETCP